MAKGRILAKKIILSKKINNVSEGAENLYYRILVMTDDFGRYHADPKIIKGQLYPLRSISLKTIEKRLNELHNIGLILMYKNDDELYLEIKQFEIFQKFRSDIQRREEYPPFKQGSRIESVTGRIEHDTACNVDSSRQNRNLIIIKSLNKNLKEELIKIINYLNERAGKNFSPYSKKTISLVKILFNEGYKFKDFKKVIDIKVTKWKGDEKMDDFLRPRTLFALSNFEDYLQEKIFDRKKQITKKEQYMANVRKKFLEKENENVK